ncbi:MAG: TIGR03986 family CRISPR-associated RAMP protein [Nostoc sp.]|uniref:TIGR03986 family type III CRISPR-associated RAMP protein n=1 Tax=Nostoc sp. TaxID=1180 RepID=UPI002FFB6216
MLPRHLDKVSDGRKAKAPYNFVELPNNIVEVNPELLPQKNIYYSDFEQQYTGRIKCRLTTESPLYIRCGLTKQEFDCGAEIKDVSDFFYTERATPGKNSKDRKPVIPGSSLRGMIRTIVEIISFSKIERVSDQQHFFFRAIAAQKDDSLGREYKNLLKEVKAGYLVRKGVNWYIKPAKSISNSPFIWVKERDLSRIHSLIKMNQQNYLPQYINVSFGDTLFKSPRRFTTQVSANQSSYPHKGILVTSGNMLESSDNSENLHRRNHCIVGEINNDVDALKINDDAIQYYRSSLTDFQKQEPFDKDFGVLEEGRPIFYCETLNGKIEVTLFGHCPNFRIPYSPNRDGIAVSAVNFIPENIGKYDKIDLADAIFGFVKSRDKDISKNSKPKTIEALASRVSIVDAICEKLVSDDIWVTGNFDEIITPKILSSPKPTTFQHYLVQKSVEKNQLKHYANKPATNNETGETVIRGHKLYWHKRNVERRDIEETDTRKIEKARSQYTSIKPIKAGISFNFDIHFENLSNVELGTMLWVLKVAAEPEYCLSLGMGKPLGMGAVKISHQLHLSDRTSRYSSLFNEKQWLTGEEDQSNTASKYSDCIKAFEKYILDNIHDDDHPQGCKATKLAEIPRIQMLLAMLRCDNPPLAENTRYMTIEPNEYKDRPILPTPLQIMDIPDNRRCKNQDIPIIKLRKDKKYEKFQVGQILDGRVTKINGVKVTYEITTTMQKLTEREPKKAASLQEEETVKVKITALKEDGSIKNVKLND